MDKILYLPFFAEVCRYFLFSGIIVTVGFSSVFPENYKPVLSDAQRKSADSISSTFIVNECCSSSLMECVKKDKKCRIARHLLSFTEYVVAARIQSDTVYSQLSRRYDSFVSKDVHTLDYSVLPWAGDSSAPVTIAVYVGASCSYCKIIVGPLYDSVTNGCLKGKARLMAKPFGTGIGDLALSAANSMGHFWDLFIAIKNEKGRLTEAELVKMAGKAGIPSGRFRAMIRDSASADFLASCRREGHANGVDATPTIFINGKRYSSFKDPYWVVDAALYEYESR